MQIPILSILWNSLIKPLLKMVPWCFSHTGLVLYKNLGCGYSLEASQVKNLAHLSEVLKVSSCGRSMSIMHCAASTIA